MSKHFNLKRVTLTSKKNWWMVELDDDEENANGPYPSASYLEESLSKGNEYHRDRGDQTPRLLHRQSTYESTPHASNPIYSPPTNPGSIFSFPTPTSYSAPPNPTQSLAPIASGSASELFKCIVKKPNVVQLEINGEMQSNARDVTTQFLAELRVYTTVARHRNICAFLGSLENVGMVLEYLDGRTLYDVIREESDALTRAKKVDFHNQLLDGLTHLHSYGLSHGDLSLLNIQVMHASDTIKLFDFGRSVSADSVYASPDDDSDERPPSPPPPTPSRVSRFATPKTPTIPLPPAYAPRKTERIYPGTRPFSAPEILRGECQDARLADAYSFGMILVCLDRCTLVDVKPWDQRKDILPKGFLDGLDVFGDRCTEYLRRFDQGRRRLSKADMMDPDVSMTS
ncbi:kinase-like protein [Lentinus tigrinus ALCF2SS1-7]|uniref:Kinase-like protein n=1 Tax=Lentinus tigrinus ALCF2SS1-6 TaxID=1328759 RepID=A0A5C2S2F3_9APHY|nr:kinase-like protein [Lentinus tigrinus ALCF2SS1-6]RPD78796.1 kinase-like protein [Lentinus tigrinus ALCF2SS1-7]